jgi:hypothetical protein
VGVYGHQRDRARLLAGPAKLLIFLTLPFYSFITVISIYNKVSFFMVTHNSHGANNGTCDKQDVEFPCLYYTAFMHASYMYSGTPVT